MSYSIHLIIHLGNLTRSLSLYIEHPSETDFFRDSEQNNIFSQTQGTRLQEHIL